MKQLRTLLIGLSLASLATMALAGDRQTVQMKRHNGQQTATMQWSKPGPQSTLGFSGNNGVVEIECCTTWDSQNGTTGCATFPGNSCPDYAPFEAY